MADPADVEYDETNQPQRFGTYPDNRRNNLSWLWSALVALFIGLIVGYLWGNFGAVSLVDFKASQADLKACREETQGSAKEFGAFKTNTEQVLAAAREEKSRADVALAKCQADLACCEKPSPKTKTPKAVGVKSGVKKHTKKTPAVYAPAPARAVSPACPSGNCSKFAWDPSDHRQPREGTISPRY